MKRLKEEAARQGRTMSEMVESSLRLFLTPDTKPEEDLSELPAFDSGGESVDISDRDALYGAMDGR